MRMPSSISIAIAAPPASDTSDSGSDAGHETRSIRRHIKLRTSSPARRKELLSATPVANGVAVDHTETTARKNPRLNIATRSRGSSRSSLLNPAVGVALQVEGENLPQPQPQPSAPGPDSREGATGPTGYAGSADNPAAPHYTIQSVDRSLVSLITTHIFAPSFSHGTRQ